MTKIKCKNSEIYSHFNCEWEKGKFHEEYKPGIIALYLEFKRETGDSVFNRGGQEVFNSWLSGKYINSDI